MASSIEDHELPKAILNRILKQSLPDNTVVQANAKIAIAKSTTLFVNYLAYAANEVATSAGHKIISGTHVLRALEQLDLEEMLPRLNDEFAAYQDKQKSRKNSAKNSKDEPATSKKRKPANGESKQPSKARKSSSGANPRDGQGAQGDDDMVAEGGDDEENADSSAEPDEDDEEAAEDEDDSEDDSGEASSAPREGSLNMHEQGREDDEAGNTSNLDEEDSDGF